jgi:lipoprotein-anchoring transpeptidase ErfK/SrfK
MGPHPTRRKNVKRHRAVTSGMVEAAQISRPKHHFKSRFCTTFINSLVIDTGGRKLYYVLPEGRAYEYAISVGREGFNWSGTETVSRKQAWPHWYPPAEMRERDPRLPEKMTGGLKNPLGAMALYLTSLGAATAPLLPVTCSRRA